MRSDLHSLQNDSSSGSSSPHSNASHEEVAMEMVENPSNILHPKVVYNFSIPEFINHERGDERSRADSRPKRSRLQRMRLQQHQSEGEHQQNNENEERIEIQDSPVIVHATKKRRRAAAAIVKPNVDVEEDDDADCHRRQRFPVIDLTGIDSHDEFNSPLAESERQSRGERTYGKFFSFYFYILLIPRCSRSLSLFLSLSSLAFVVLLSFPQKENIVGIFHSLDLQCFDTVFCLF